MPKNAVSVETQTVTITETGWNLIRAVLRESSGLQLERENGRVVVEGMVNGTMLYISDDIATPYVIIDENGAPISSYADPALAYARWRRGTDVEDDD